MIEERHPAVLGQGLHAVTQVDPLVGIEAGHVRHHAPADSRVGRRVIFLARQVGQFLLVGIDGHVPVFRQLLDRPDVVEVAMGQHDRQRVRMSSPKRLCAAFRIRLVE